MKMLLISLFVLFSIVTNKDFSEFDAYVGKNLRPPIAITNNCEWQSAVVKFHTNKKNVIVTYSMLNTPVKELSDSFKFLIGHRLVNENSGGDKDYVFCVSIENHKSNCYGKQRQLAPAEVLSSTLGYYSRQYKINPKTIFIYEVIDVSYSYDSER